MSNADQTPITDERRPAAKNACPQCGTRDLTARHCKAVCEQCGYVESCEDLFPRAKSAIA